MPPLPNRRGGRLRRIILIAAVAVFTGGVYACQQIGSFLYREDALQRADAIFVLAGTRMERPLEAADLYLEGWARRVVLTEDVPDSGVLALERRGLALPSTAATARDVMVRLGVPGDAVEILPGVHNSTSQEAETLRRTAERRGWTRVIVVTSKFHTRRAAFAARRAMERSGIEVVMRGSRYDRADPAHWWRSRSDVRWTISETQKLAGYMLGLGL